MIRTSAFAVAAALLTAACNPGGGRAGSLQRFATQSGRVELTAPAGWTREVDTPFDLQLVSRNGRANTGVNEYLSQDLASGTQPHDLLAQVAEDLRSKRRNFVRVEAEKTIDDGPRRLTRVLYAGEKDSSRFHYRLVLVEFPATPDVFLVLIQVAFPSDWGKAEPVLDAIARSVALRDEGRRKE